MVIKCSAFKLSDLRGFKMKYPIYPELKVCVKDSEFIDGAFYFDLKLTGSVLNCFIDDMKKIEVEYDYQPDSDPQNTVGRPASYFSVGVSSHCVYVDGGDLDELGLIRNQCLRMTEQQERDINVYLEGEWKWL